MTAKIPYANKHVTRSGRVYATCPICKLKILLLIRKDRDSMSGREYTAHYAAAHATSEKP